MREAAYGKLTAGYKAIRGRKDFYKRPSVDRNNKPYRDFARYGLAYNSVYVIAYHVFIVDKQIIVAVAAIPELFAESSRHIAVFAWFAP